MHAIRKFVGCVKVAAGLGAVVMLGLSVQTASAHAIGAPSRAVTVNTPSISAGCLSALQALRDALVADRQEDGEEFLNPAPTGEATEDPTEAGAFQTLISSVRAACAPEIAAIKAVARPPVTGTPSSACTSAVLALKAYLKSLWAQHSPPTAAEQAQLRQLGQAVRAACGWFDPAFASDQR